MNKSIRKIVTGAGLALCCMGTTLPAFAQQAIWVTSGNPQSYWGTISAVYGQESNGLMLFAVSTVSTDPVWEAWNGLPSGPNRWRMEPSGSGINTDLKGTWVVTSNSTAEFQVAACSRECGAFLPGRTIQFRRILHQASAPPSGPGPGTRVQSGTYETETNAFEACLNVDASGTRLTSSGSRCEDGNAIEIDIDDDAGTSSLGGSCNTNVDIPGPININNGSFTATHTVSNPWFNGTFRVTGTFSGNTVSGTMSGQGTYIPGVCTGNWSARLR